MKRYLVTGAQGFTGRFAIAELLRADPHAEIVATGRSARTDDSFTHEVTWLDRALRAPLPVDLRPGGGSRYRYVCCDLTQPDAVESLVREAAPEIVLHLAAALRDEPAERLVRTNVFGTATLLAALGGIGRKPLVILASSGSVYGSCDMLPVRESERCAPIEPYALDVRFVEIGGEFAHHRGLSAQE